VLKDPERLARCLHNSHDAIDGDGGIAGQVELFELSGRASNRKEVVVSDGHEGSIAEDLQASQLAEVDRLQRLQIHEVILVCGLL
jgi:hypothetical protein